MSRGGASSTLLRLALLLLVLTGALVPAPGLLLAQTDAGKGKGEEDGDDDLGSMEKDLARELAKLEKGLRRALNSKSLDDIAYWVEQVGSLRTPDAVEVVLRVGQKYVEDPVRSAVVNALIWARHSDDCLAFYLKEIRKGKKIERKIIVVEALDRIDGPLAEKALIAALRIPDTRVLTAAVRALRHKPSRDSVTAVLALYRKVAPERDLLAAETRITLLTVTGQKYELYEDWANWWLIHKDKWQPRKDPAAEKRARTEVYRPKREYEIPKLFGQEVSSKRVVFVIDNSSSMEKQDAISGSEGGGGKSRIRIERAKKELIKVVLALRDDVEFNIVAYDTYVKVWKEDQLLRASRANKKRALKFVEGMKAEGHTNTLDAMLAAMDVKEVDTIILLSDGSPTIPGEGGLADPEPILERIRRENRFKKITIHTLGFRGAAVRFMRTLASDGGGTFAPID